MKIIKRIVTTEEVEACHRCEKREAKWSVEISVHDMEGGEKDYGSSAEFFCESCMETILGSLTLKRRPRKAKVGEPV